MKFKTIIASIAMLCLIAVPAVADTVNTGAAGLSAAAQGQQQAINGPLIDQSGQKVVNRGAIVPADIAYPGFNAHFDKATPDHRFIPIKNIILLQETYSAEAAQNMLDAAEGDIELKLRPLVKVDTKAEGYAPSDAVTVGTLEKLPAGVRTQLALGTCAADGVDAISVDLMATLIAEASKMQATHIVFMGEGVNRIIKSFSWGVGLSSSYAYLSDDDKSGTLTTGGLGVSGGTSGYKHLPWLQFAFVKIQ